MPGPSLCPAKKKWLRHGGGGVKQGAGVTPEVLVAHGVDTQHGLDVALDTLVVKVK